MDLWSDQVIGNSYVLIAQRELLYIGDAGGGACGQSPLTAPLPLTPQAASAGSHWSPLAVANAASEVCRWSPITGRCSPPPPLAIDTTAATCESSPFGPPLLLTLCQLPAEAPCSPLTCPHHRCHHLWAVAMHLQPWEARNIHSLLVYEEWGLGPSLNQAEQEKKQSLSSALRAGLLFLFRVREVSPVGQIWRVLIFLFW